MLGMLGRGEAGDQASASREGLQKKYEKGDASSCLALGELYDMGRGVALDKQRAAALFEQACKGGAAAGCSSLGRLYENGWGVSQDSPHAVALYEQACQAGAAEGCYNLDGKGVAQDLQRAAVLFEQGCKGRDANPEACVRAALESISPSGVWQELHFSGNSVLHARLFEDGLVQLWSEAIDVDRRAVVVQLESLTVPGPEVLEALGAGPVRNACQPPPQGGSGGDLSACGYPHGDYMEADSGCDGDRRVCHVSATGNCDECKTACATTCDGCRLRCWTQSSQNHGKCVESCLATTRQCEESCQNRLDAANKACTSASTNKSCPGDSPGSTNGVR